MVEDRRLGRLLFGIERVSVTLGRDSSKKKIEDALVAVVTVTRPHISELRPLICRGNRADGAVVNTTAPFYKMKCPSLRKMTRNEEFFGKFDSRRAYFFFLFSFFFPLF